MGGLSLTACKPQQRRRFAPLVPGVTHVPYPNLYRRPEGSDAKQYAMDCAHFIEEKLFKTTLPPEEVAAIFVEAIQGEGGYVVAPAEFMQELRRICDNHGILLVVADTQPASSPTGKHTPPDHTRLHPPTIPSH